jgi:broad specificity phosphatase PhoE
MTYLLLVKHSLPAIDPAVPAANWQLAESGRQRCALLAASLASYHPAILVSSTEPKAIATAELLWAALTQTHKLTLSLPAVWPGLHEHQRAQPGLLSQADFEAAIQRLFAAPDQLVYGEETANQAARRFETAVGELLAKYPDQTLAIVAHGTVISLFTALHTGLAPLALWQRLGLPSSVVLDRQTFKLMDVINVTSR